MNKKRNRSQVVSNEKSKRKSQSKPGSDDDSDDDPSSQFVNDNEDKIKDCLVYLLAQNSTLLPFKKSDIFSQFNEKLGRKNRDNILATLKSRLSKIGACLKPIDNKKFIIVNKIPKNLLLELDNTLERQFLCLILCFIAINKGTIKKNELENCLIKLGVHIQNEDPYFGDVNKLLLLFEKQCYLKKSTCQPDKGIVEYEWGIRAKYEVDKDAIMNCLASKNTSRNSFLSGVNLSIITSPEDELVSETEND